MLNNVKNAITRVTLFETKLDRCNAAHKKLRNALEEFRSVQRDVAELDRYYSGPEWKEDFELDEQGLIPENIKRGILSEDGLYNMLEENQELTMILGEEKAIKKN